MKLSGDVVPGGYGGTSEQADAASGPVPKHPGPSYFLHFTSFGLVRLDPTLLRKAFFVGKGTNGNCLVDVIGDFGTYALTFSNLRPNSS